MRISDWSSDVCSSDLRGKAGGRPGKEQDREQVLAGHRHLGGEVRGERHGGIIRSEEHTSELQSLMRISYAVFCLKKKTQRSHKTITIQKHNLQKLLHKYNNDLSVARTTIIPNKLQTTDIATTQVLT